MTIKNLPTIPPLGPGQGKNPTVEAIRQILLSWKGEAGNKLDQVVTRRDLLASGIGKLGAGGVLVPDGDYIPPPPTYVTVLSNLTANGGFGMIFLDWDGTNQPAYAHTEIWRSADNNLSNAILLGTSIASLFVDHNVDSGESFFYWVRAISTTGNAGPFNATDGVYGEAVLSPDYIIDLIEGMIDEDSLAAELLTPIQAIPGIQTTLADHGIRLPVVEDFVTQLNITVPNIQDMLDDLADRVPVLEASADEFGDRLDLLDSQVAAYRNIPAWSNTNDYLAGALVRYGGVTWRALQDMTAPSPTPAEGAYWHNIGNYITYDGVLAADASAIDDLDVRITDAEGALTAVATDITALETSIADIESGGVATSSAISALDSRVTAAEGNITAAASDISALETSLASTNSNVSANSSATSALDSRVTDAEGDITAQASDITALETALATTNGNVSANSSAITALDSRVTTAEGAITAQATDITALESAVSDAETDILANASAVSALDTRVVATESAVSAHAGQITSLEAAIDDLTIDEWSSATTYAVNDMFKYLGDFYRVIATQTPPNATPPNATYYEVDPDYSSLPSEVAANAAAIAALDTRVTVAEGTITSHSSSITSLTSSISDAEDDIDANASAISALDSRVDTAEGTISSHSSSITGLTSSLATTNGNVTANAGAISALDSRVDTTESTISSHASSITGLTTSLATTNGNVTANAAAVSALDTRVDATEAGISTHTSQITSLTSSLGTTNTNVAANTSAINTLDTRLDEAEGDITAQASDITALQISVTAAHDDIDDAESAITANTGAISTLNTQVTAAQGAITTHTSQITTLTNNLTTAQGNIAANSSAVGALQTSVASQGGQITALGSRTTILETEVDALQAADTATATVINQLDSRVDATEASIVSQGSSLTSINASITGLTNNVGALGGTVSGHAAALSLLTGRVTAAEGVVEVHADRIDQLELDMSLLDVEGNAAALQELDARITATEGEIDVQASSMTSLSATVNGHTAALEDKAEVSVVANLNGTVSNILAQRTIKLDVNGRVSGIGLMNDGVTSKFIVASDAVYFIDPGQSVTPFNPNTNYATEEALRETQFAFGYALVEGQRRFVINMPSYLPLAYIQSVIAQNITVNMAQVVDLLVSEAEIADAAITSAKISNIIQSDNFQSGSHGWQIRKNGHAEFNDIAVYDPDGRLAFATGLNYLVAVDDPAEMVNVTRNPDFSELYLATSTMRPVGVQIEHANDGILSAAFNDALPGKGMYFIYNSGAGAQTAIVRRWTRVEYGQQYRIRARVRVASFLVSGAELTLRVNQRNSLPATGIDYILDTRTSANSIPRDSVVVLGTTPYSTEWYDFDVSYTPALGVQAISPVLSFQCRYTVSSVSHYTRVECELLTVAAMRTVVGTTYIRDAAITSAKIGDAAIGTLKIGGNAVTVTQAVEEATIQIGGSGWSGGSDFLALSTFTINHGHSEDVLFIFDMNFNLYLHNYTYTGQEFQFRWRVGSGANTTYFPISLSQGLGYPSGTYGSESMFRYRGSRVLPEGDNVVILEGRYSGANSASIRFVQIRELLTVAFGAKR